MAYEPLHHKYRPQTFGDLVGQETIALTLSNALKQGKIAPAYLFTGPRGTGKTSSARILAKSLNCLASNQPTPEPCGQCEVCLAIAKGSALDVMEIDAASNTGVDNIREIIERSRFAPVQCRYKIYAIDECHMLSTAAFNALLKTLEEPPPQVVFILATTDPQRVLSTIISRCQRFDYRRIPLKSITSHLRYIADAESIAIADNALTLVAQISNGGLRDAESLLDQLSLLPETITVEKVWDLVGAVAEQDLLKLLQAINGNDSLAVLQQCRSLLDRGREPLGVLQNLATFYLNLLIAKTAPQHGELTAVTETCWQQLCTEGKNWQTALILRGQQHLKEAETQLKRTTQPRLWLEVTLLGLLPEVQRAIAIPPQPIVSTSVKQEVAPATVASTPPTVPQQTPTTPKTPIPPDQHVPVTATTQLPPPQPVAQHYHHHQATSVAQPPTTVAPEPVVSTVNQDPAANQQIWNKVVSCLQPHATQELVTQKCHLVSFDGLSALVGISSATLQKLHQGKVPNIEAAFNQVCQHKVRVQLEVASSQDNIAKNPPASINQPVAETPRPSPEQLPNPPTPATTQIVQQIETVAVKPQSLGTQHPAIPQTAAPSTLPNSAVKSFNHNSQVANKPPGVAAQNPSVLNPPTIPQQTTVENNVALPKDTSLNLPELSPDQDYAARDLQQAIASLTQSFEGKVVQLDNMDNTLADYFAESENLSEPQAAIPLERPNIEEYDDDW